MKYEDVLMETKRVRTKMPPSGRRGSGPYGGGPYGGQDDIVDKAELFVSDALATLKRLKLDNMDGNSAREFHAAISHLQAAKNVLDHA